MGRVLNTNTFFFKSVNMILVLLPILQTYGWTPFDFSFILVISLSIWSIFIKIPHKNEIPFFLNIYLVYYLLTYLMGGLIAGNSNLPLGWIKIYLVYYLFFSHTKIKLLRKYYSLISYVAILFYIVQVFLWELFGIRIIGIFNNLPLTIDMDADRYIAFMNADHTRLCSFFSEPAMFAQYLLPLSALTLFDRTIRHRYCKFMIILATFLLLNSGNAIFILSIVMACYIIHNLIKSFSLRSLFGVITILILVGVGSTYYMESETGESLIERQSEFEVSETYTSGFLRVYRGYYVYESLDIWEQIFGANNTVLMENAIRHCKIPYLFGDQDYYFNTVQNILIKTGIVGAILFTIFLIGTFRKANPVGKTILIGLTILSFIASMYLSYIMLLYLIFSVKLTVIRNEKGRYINYSHRN